MRRDEVVDLREHCIGSGLGGSTPWTFLVFFVMEIQSEVKGSLSDLLPICGNGRWQDIRSQG